MLFVPLPFVVAVLLLVLFVSVLRRNEGSTNRPFLALILVSACLSLLTGLRWGYEMEAVRFIAPVVAATVPPLVYTGVSRLVRKRSLSPGLSTGLHALPAFGIVLLELTWRELIDIALVLIFVGYAVAILLMMRRGTDALRLAPFDGAVPAYQAIIFAACALLFSAAVDTFVFLDLAWTQGQYARPMITLGNLAAFISLSIAAAAVIRSHAPEETPDVAPSAEEAGDKEIIAALDTLMADKQLYLDVDLNLDRLARRACIPTRQISAAVNRVMGKNVSQYVNSFRITEACRLLDETSRPVTEIMYEAGFQTKSNFNREFRRSTDMTPIQWRERPR